MSQVLLVMIAFLENKLMSLGIYKLIFVCFCLFFF